MKYIDVEKFLTELKSVNSCKIVSNGSDQIEEIHVLADNGRNSKQISRDIQSTLLSKFNIDIDYKKISIAQINEKAEFNVNRRIKLESINYETCKDNISVQVTLKLNDKIYQGTAGGVRTERNTLKIGAEALLKSVEDITKKYNIFLLESLELKSFSGREIVLVAISVIENNREDVLCGSAFVEFSRLESTVKACLSAVNRRALKYINI
jgi:hypothetical protein